MHCEQCQRPLAHAEDICPVCAVELSQSTVQIPDLTGTAGRFECPACHGKFDYWTTALHPANARWYVPQNTINACPLCAVALDWQRESQLVQVPQTIQGVAFGTAWALSQSIPRELQQRFGMGFSLLTLAVLIALLHFTVRYPFLSTVGQGAGRFAVANDTYAGRKREWALVLTILALMAVAWTTPDVHWAKVWAAGVGFAVMGCLAAVIWHIRAEQRLRRSVL